MVLSCGLAWADDGEEVGLDPNIFWIILSVYEVVLVSLVVMSYPKKSYFVAYLFYNTFLQFMRITVRSDLKNLKETLDLLFRPFQLIQGYPNNFFQNIIDEILLKVGIIILLTLKYRKVHENRSFFEFLSFFFVSTIQSFFYFASENIKSVINSQVKIADSFEISGFVVSVLFILSVFIYLGVLLAKFKSSISISTIYKEDFERSWIFYLGFLALLLLTSFFASALSENQLVYILIFMIFDVSLSKSYIVIIGCKSKKYDRKKCFFLIIESFFRLFFSFFQLLALFNLISTSSFYYILLTLIVLQMFICLLRSYLTFKLQKETSYIMNNPQDSSTPVPRFQKSSNLSSVKVLTKDVKFPFEIAKDSETQNQTLHLSDTLKPTEPIEDQDKTFSDLNSSDFSKKGRNLNSFTVKRRFNK
jgi:hypothetical protein